MLQIDQLRIHLPGQSAPAVDGVDLEVADGEFVAIVGPSGSGKSTLLRGIAGLTNVASGSIRMDDTDHTSTPAQRRPSTLVFDSPMLLPEFTVEQTVAFTVDLAAAGEATHDAVEAAITSFDLGTLRDRPIHELSRGQQQRVALARALVRRPSVLLLDEPLAGIEPSARRSLRSEIVRMHRRMGCATLLATHDADDALALADRILLLREGRVVQEGHPREVFTRPAGAWVAARLGISLFLRASVEEVSAGMAVTRVLGMRLRVPCARDVTPGANCTLVGPSGAVRVASVMDEPGDVAGAFGRVRSHAFVGHHTELEVETVAGTLPVLWESPDPPAVGALVRVELAAERLWAIPR